MRNWMDFNDDGEIDITEMMLAEELLCTSDEEEDTEVDFEMDAITSGLDPVELRLMDEDERAEVLEEAGLDPDDYDFD